jgi:hypothetical protein
MISRPRPAVWNRATGPLSSPRVNHRVGVCSSCRSRYQIPATFAHDRARCRSCGGVVEIGPLEADAPAPPATPASTPASNPAPAPSPSPARAPVSAAPVATPTESSRAPAASPIAEPTAPPRRSPLVAVLVGALILAAIAFGAWRLFS